MMNERDFEYWKDSVDGGLSDIRETIDGLETEISIVRKDIQDINIGIVANQKVGKKMEEKEAKVWSKIKNLDSSAHSLFSYLLNMGKPKEVLDKVIQIENNINELKQLLVK